MKMNILCFYILGLAFLLQQTHGSWLEKYTNESSSSLIEPINRISKSVEANIADLEAKKVQLDEFKKELAAKLKNTTEECKTVNLLSHARILSMWDIESCMNLTGDWETGVLLGMNMTIYGTQIGNLIWNSLNDVMSCDGMNILKVIPCYYNGIKGLIKEIETFKKILSPIVAEAKEILTSMEKDFQKCVGIPYKLKDKIERNLKDC